MDKENRNIDHRNANERRNYEAVAEKHRFNADYENCSIQILCISELKVYRNCYKICQWTLETFSKWTLQFIYVGILGYYNKTVRCERENEHAS